MRPRDFCGDVFMRSRAASQRRSGTVLVALGVLITGCQSLDFTAVNPAEQPRVESTASTDPAPIAATESSANDDVAIDAGTPAVDPNLVASFRQWLDQDEWQIDVNWSVLTADGVCPSRPWRWTFVANSQTDGKAISSPGNERWSWVWAATDAAWSETDKSAATSALKSLQGSNDRPGRNAAILLARLRPEPSADVTKLLQNLATGTGTEESPSAKPVPLKTRCAAAEAWCRCLATSTGSTESNLTPAGSLLILPGIPDELQGTLWRCLAPHIVPDKLPNLAAAVNPATISRVSPGQRQAAVEACIIAAASIRQQPNPADEGIYRESDWPLGLIAQRSDEVPLMRQLVGRWVAWAQAPDAPGVLSAQLRDIEPMVRETAIASLGILQTPTARDALRTLAQTSTPRHQMLAVTALTKWGAAEVSGYVNSEVADLRIAVAKGLGNDSSPESIILRRRLLADTHPEVQSAAVESARQLPVEHAVPLLLTAMETSDLAARKTAQTALNGLVPDPPILPIEGSAAERRDAVRLWAAIHGYSLEPWLGVVTASGSGTLSDERPELTRMLQAFVAADSDAARIPDAVEQLRSVITIGDVSRIEAAMSQGQPAAVRVLQREGLPKISVCYAALLDMDSPDIQRRREAARRLQLQAASQPLSPMFLRSLAEVLIREQDFLVWQAVLASVAEDGHDAAEHLAILALSHPWPDVRRLGAEHLQRHPAPAAVTALLPLLQDSQPQVQIAAIRALGMSGSPWAVAGFPGQSIDGSVSGLRGLMSSQHQDVRWEALSALVKLRDDVALVELVRLLQDGQTPVRLRAVRALASSGQQRSIEPLIRLSWTESTDLVKQEILKGLVTLVPPEEQPACDSGLVLSPSIDDKIRCWVAWWDSRRLRTVATPQSSDGAEINR